MRIWAFPSFYPYNVPGMRWAGIFAHRQYKALVDNGVSLKVVQPVKWAPIYPFYLLDSDWKNSAKLNFPKKRTYDGVEIYHPKIKNLKPSRFFKAYSERYIQSIVDFFTKNDIRLNPDEDIFYAQWIPDAANVQIAAHKLGVKSALLVIGDDVLIEPYKDKNKQDIFVAAWKAADVRLAVADYLGKAANELVKADLPYTVVRRGVNYDFFKPLPEMEKKKWRQGYNIPANKVAILTIGSAIVRKGWLDLFDALAKLKNIDPEFVLIGVHAGKGEIDLNKEAGDRGLKDHFIDIGEIDPKDMNEFINATDIFCLPSHSEGISNAVVEAMACGLPVITTNVCGHPEVIKNGSNGILINASAPNEIYESLKSLLSDKKKMELLGINARNFIVNEWGDYAFNSAKLYTVLSKA